MTVKELIKCLKNKPQDAKVVVIASDGDGYNEVTKPEIVNIVFRPDYPLYEGMYGRGTQQDKVAVRLW